MLLGFKTELKVNQTQRILLAQHAGVARHAWNWGLGLTKQILDNNRSIPDALKDTATHNKIKFPSAIDLHKWLVALVKPECPWYYGVSKCAPQYALRHLRRAWDDCFSKSKKPPKFKKKGKSDSFTIDGSIKLEPKRIKVPRIGWLKSYERLPTDIKPRNAVGSGQRDLKSRFRPPKSVTISKRANKWFISWKIEIQTQQIAPSDRPISVDLGLLRFATLSTGEEVHSPRPYKQLEKKLAKHGAHAPSSRSDSEPIGSVWRNRLKVIGSANWKKAQNKIAKLHYRISCIRSDFIHRLTTRLAKNHSHCVIEDLCVSGLIKNRKLSKAIADSGWGEFRRQLEYETKLYGSELMVANRFFASSKLCPKCGHKKDKLPLNVRVYECDKDSCNWVADRDYCAAINLLNLLGVANPDVMPVEKQELTLFGEAGTNNQQEKDNDYVQLSLFVV